MIITIQSINKRFVVKTVYGEVYSCKSMIEATKLAWDLANTLRLYAGERPTIKILPIIHTPMAMKSKDYPAKKKAVVKKAKKAVKKPAKK